MERDRIYLIDIVESAKRIESIIADLTRETFERNETGQLAVLHLLTIIGEASRRVSDTLRESHVAHHFRSAIAMRNIIVHQYDAVDLDVVWRTATVSVPKFREELEKMFGVEPNDSQTK